MTDVLSLTQDEARERATLLDVHRYDLELDLTGLADGDALRATSTIAFSASTPGSTTFVDCLGDVEEAELNGRPLPAGPTPGGRLELGDLQADNVLVVRSVQRRTAAGQGVHRAVDPSDGEVYVWTTFEPDDARVVFACFDQPDLKAVFGITVHVPQRWLVTSNTGDADITTKDGVGTWTYADTPRLSTYVVVVNAGPYVELRSTRAGFDLGLYARRSLAPMLERDAEELFDLTAQGLTFFGEQFAMPFPQQRYDQVFAPEFGGAMENYGCVTWSDGFVFRDPPSYSERELRALVLLHEMAHMWFGDIVTMRWWDDLWLNESFAEWACGWAAIGSSEFTDMWAGMLATEKQDAYAADAAPTTHPIRQDLVDVATAQASFDDITYPKGAAVLKQLVAYVGEDAFVAGLRSYFRTHAWGNTTLDDLIAELATASGRDLTGWVEGWLETSGTDRLTLEVDGGDLTLVATPPEGRGPLPHRLLIGAYADRPDELALLASVPVEVSGERTAVDASVEADLWLVNDDDQTFAVVRPDPASRRLLLSRGGHLPTAVARTLAVTTAWRLLYDGQLTAQEFVDCAVHVLQHETADSVVEPLLIRLVEVADQWAPLAARAGMLTQVADLCVSLASDPDRRVAALRALAYSATTAEPSSTCSPRRRPTPTCAGAGSAVSPSSTCSTTPTWRTCWRRTPTRTPGSARSKRAPHARRPRPRPRHGSVLVEDRKIPPGSIRRIGRSFWRPWARGARDAVRRAVAGDPGHDRRLRDGVGAEHDPRVLPDRRRRRLLPRPPRRGCRSVTTWPRSCVRPIRDLSDRRRRREAVRDSGTS